MKTIKQIKEDDSVKKNDKSDESSEIKNEKKNYSVIISMNGITE
jgi:hypothetical protein